MKLVHLAVSALWALLSTAAASEKIQILTTVAPIFSLTKNVAGDAADVAQLLQQESGPHAFNPTPRDVQKIAEADVVVENGFGLEPWLDRVVPTGLKVGALRIVAARGIEPIMNAADPAAVEPNPHVWLDPVLAIREVENIRDGLMKRDPANADAYLANANIYTTRLRNLDDEIGLATVTMADQRVLTWRDAFAYFASRYGFDTTAFFAADSGHDLTALEVSRLEEILRTKKITALWDERAAPAQGFAAIARRRHLPVAVLNPMETGSPSAEYYENIMRKNLQSLAKALK